MPRPTHPSVEAARMGWGAVQPLDQVDEAFELMERQDGIRSVLTLG